MGSCRLGYCTADEIGVKWTSLGIVRAPNFRFYAVEFIPDRQVFSSAAIVQSSFELPPIDFIKARRYAELPDGSFVSTIDSKEISPCTSITATLLDAKIDFPEWQFVERGLSRYIRDHRLALVNDTLLTTEIANGQTVRLRLAQSQRTPKLFVVGPSTTISYIHASRAPGAIEFPTFRDLADRLQRFAANSLDAKQTVHSKGCVISGASGSGRSFLVRYVADRMRLRFLEIDAEAFETTELVFQPLSQKVPKQTIVLLKSFDGHLLNRDSPFERRLVSQLSALIDRSSQVFFAMTVLAAQIPGALQTASRLGFALIVPPLSRRDMEAILSPRFDQSVIDSAIGLPLSALVGGDLADAIGSAHRSHIRGSVAHTEWADIGGLAETKRIVRESVEWPLTRARELRALGIRPPRGVLLHGPPGCGKTMIARAIATSLSSAFFAVSAASLFQMYLGESERVVRELFALARQSAPAVIFIDEIDAMVGKRGHVTGVSERVLSTFLNEMDGVTQLSDVIVVAATNRKDALDEALCRPGRFDCLVEMKAPESAEEIRDVLSICARKMPLEDGLLDEVAALIRPGSSGAEIDNVCREAALCALQDESDLVTIAHFRRILSL
jgi:ATP-dependent 26S proteasome regulatory subunit